MTLDTEKTTLLFYMKITSYIFGCVYWPIGNVKNSVNELIVQMR